MFCVKAVFSYPKNYSEQPPLEASAACHGVGSSVYNNQISVNRPVQALSQLQIASPAHTQKARARSHLPLPGNLIHKLFQRSDRERCVREFKKACKFQKLLQNDLRFLISWQAVPRLGPAPMAGAVCVDTTALRCRR